MTVREKNGRIEPSGPVPKRFGGALAAELPDELVTLDQLRRFIGISLSESFDNQTTNTTLSHQPLETQHCTICFDSGFGGFVVGLDGLHYTRSGSEITWTPALSNTSVLAIYSYSPE